MFDQPDRELAKNLWHLLNRIRGRLVSSERAIFDLLEAFAALIVLKHAAYIDRSADESCFLHWKQVQTLPANDVAAYFSSSIWSWLNKTRLPKSLGFLGLILEVQHLLTSEPELFAFARDRINEYDFDFAEERLALANELDTYIQLAAEKSIEIGEVTTPPQLTDLIVTLASPVVGETFYDPFCGMGGFLASIAKKVAEPCVSSGKESTKETRISGMDIRPSVALIATARVILSGFESPQICVGDSQEVVSSRILDSNVTCVISNPPFGGKRTKRFEGALGVPTKGIEILAIQHIVASLAQGGRALIIVPENFLFASSGLPLRKLLLSDYCVEAVIAVPRGAFSRYTSIKTNILVVSKQSPKENVLFVSEELTRRMLSDGVSRPIRSTILSTLLHIRRSEQALPQNFHKVLDEMFTGLRSARDVDSSGGNLGLLSETSDVLQLMELLPTRDQKLVKAIERCRKEFDANKTFNQAAWVVPISELVDRSYELVVKPPMESGLGEFLQEVTSIAPEALLRNLSDIAEVFTGIHYKSEFTSEIENHTGTIPLIRVQDVTLAAKKALRLPELTKPHKYLLPIATGEITERVRLRTGDIVLTAGGTVGKVGIVGDAAVRSVPSNGIIVIRVKDDVSPTYLLRLFQSLAYQQWFSASSSGSTIRHLSVQKVRNLPVVLLPHELARRMTEFLSGGEDSATILQLLGDMKQSERPRHFLHERLLRELLAPVEWESEDSERWWSLLSQWLEESNILDNRKTADPYLARVRMLASELIEAKSLTDTADRYSLLQSWRDKVPSLRHIHTLTVVDGQMALWPSIYRQYAEELTTCFIHACSAQSAKLLQDIKLDSSASPSVINIGETSEIQIAVTNKSALPLRKLRFETTPVTSSSTTTWLKTGDSHSWTVQLKASSPGRQSVYISWTGERMDGSLIDGRLEVAVEANTQLPVSLEEIFAQNPYVCGPPIDSTEMFYGRTDIIRKLQRSLRKTGPSTVIILEGNRRVGKTSLCKQLLPPNPELLPGWITAYWSLQAAPGHASLSGLHTSEIYYNISRALILALYEAKIPVEIVGLDQQLDPAASGIYVRQQLEQLHPFFTDENAFRLIDSQIDAVCVAVGEKRVVLILDEFEKLQEGIDNGITSPQLPENIRDLFQRYNKLSGVLTGSKRIKRLREEYWSILFGIGIRINVGALDEAATRDLIQKPSEGVLIFSPSSVEKVMELCACMPFLIQSLCYFIFEECANKGVQGVTNGIVESAAAELVDENEHFKALWLYISNDRRRYIAYLVVSLSGGQDVITSSFLAQRLEADGINPSSLDDDIAELRELDVLAMREFNQGNSYYIGIPLFALWMRKHNDFALCRDKALSE